MNFDISVDFGARMRAAVLIDQPQLEGQSDVVLDEAARVYARKMIRDWVFNTEARTATVDAISSVPVPTDADIL